jgi:hypothetical protein
MITPLRPMSLSQLLDRSFFLYREHFGLFVGIAALPHLALLAFQLLEIFISPAPRRILVTFEWLLPTLVVSFAVAAIAAGATVVAVSRVHLGQRTSILESFAPIQSRALSLVSIVIAMGLMVGTGFVFLIIPGVILGLMWSLTVPVAVLEGSGLVQSLSRSKELTKGSRGEIFLIYILILALTYAIYLLVQGPVFYAIRLSMLARHGTGGLPVWTQVALPIGGFFARCLVGPLMTITFSLIYYDQRVKKEAFDLQHMMATLDSAQGDAPTPAPA